MVGSNHGGRVAKVAGAGVSLQTYSNLANPVFWLTIHCRGGWDPSLVLDPCLVEGLQHEEGRVLQTSPISYVQHSSRPSVDQFFQNHGSSCVIINGLHSPKLEDVQSRRESDGYFHKKFKRWMSWPSTYAFRKAPFFTMPHAEFGTQMMAGPYGWKASYWSDSIINGETQNPWSETEKSALDLYIRRNHSYRVSELNENDMSRQRIRTLQKSHSLQSQKESIVQQLDFSSSDSLFLRRLKTAAYLFSQDLCISANVEHTDYWDVHNQTVAQHSTFFESLFSDLVSFMTYMDELGLLDRIAIVVKSEFGRGPQNAEGIKPHWPVNSALLIGQMFNGGNVFGQVASESFREMKVNPFLGTLDETNGVRLEMKNIYAAMLLKDLGYLPMNNIQTASFIYDFESEDG